MAFFYIKSSGTATDDAGRETTARTGVFESNANNFASVGAALSSTGTAPAAGDQFRISSASSHSYAGTTTHTFPTGDSIAVVSVDDSNQERYLAGASETIPGAGDLSIFGGSRWYGVTLSIGDDLTVSTNDHCIMTDCSVTLRGSGSLLNVQADGMYFGTINTDIIFTVGVGAGAFVTNNGSIVEMVGGSIVATANDIDTLINLANGGTHFWLTAVDLTDVVKIMEGLGAATTDDSWDVRIKGCKVQSGIIYADEEFLYPGMRLLVTNSTDVSGDAEFQFYQRTYSGDIEDQDSAGIVRTDTTAFPGGDDVSFKVTTSSSCSIFQPLVFDMPSRYAELSSASTDTIRIYFAVATATTLTDTNFWAELIYPDGTNKQTYNYATNRAGNSSGDILASGTEHTDDSGSSVWEDNGVGLTGHNEYRMDVTSSGDVGADSVPFIRIHVGEPSVTIYVDTTVDVVA